MIAFTKNVGGYMAYSCYTKELFAKYGTMMPSYPQLDDNSLNAIYDYIKSEDIKRGIDLTNSYTTVCDDSCAVYDSLRFRIDGRIDELRLKREELFRGNEFRIKYNRLDSVGNEMTPANNNASSLPDKVLVQEYRANYYRFDIQSFGWYNVDVLQNEYPADAGKLVVQVDETLSNEWSLFIAVPEKKIFDRGGRLSDKTNYGFFARDGKIPIAAGNKVVVFALSENNDKIFFDYKEFISTGNDVIELEPKTITKEEFNRLVKTWALDDITIEANDAKNAEEIRKADKEIKSQHDYLESMRPKNCDCNCGYPSDSTQTVVSELNPMP